MLDAIATENAYTDATAITVGYAVQSGTVLQKDGIYWKELGTSNYKDSSLITRLTSNIVSIGTSSQSYVSSWDCNGKISLSKATGQYLPNSASFSTNGLLL